MFNAEKTIEVQGFIFPTQCPQECPGRLKISNPNSICLTCPIFHCVPNDGIALCKPEDFNKNYAKVWKDWFDNGMKGEPRIVRFASRYEHRQQVYQEKQIKQKKCRECGKVQTHYSGLCDKCRKKATERERRNQGREKRYKTRIEKE